LFDELGLGVHVGGLEALIRFNFATVGENTALNGKKVTLFLERALS
jgi:hypothetical protein